MMRTLTRKKDHVTTVLPLPRYIIPCDEQWLLAYMLQTCWKLLLYWEHMITSAKLTCFIIRLRPGEKLESFASRL